jgi:hypothetical protein
MITKYKYFEKFSKLLFRNPDKNGEKVWELLEIWHTETMGKPRFKTYGTFKKEKSKFDNSEASR